MPVTLNGDTGVAVSTGGVYTFADGSSQSVAASDFGYKNRFINGGMAIDQRNNGSSRTFTAGSALAYSIDRWYGYCTGANVTGQRVTGTAPNQYNYRFTGAFSVTKIGFAQRIEAANSQDMAGTTVALSVDLANSLLTTVTWTAWYANSTDTFGTLASPTRTQIATGSWTVNSTLSRYSTTISIPSAATTGIEVEFSVGAQTSGTWTIGQAQIEIGNSASSFDRRSIGLEEILCRRYYYRISPGLNSSSFGFNGYAFSTTSAPMSGMFPVQMRDDPTALEQSGTAGDYSVSTPSGVVACSSVPTFSSATNATAFQVNFTVASGLTTGQALFARTGATTGTNAYLGWSAEL